MLRKVRWNRNDVQDEYLPCRGGNWKSPGSRKSNPRIGPEWRGALERGEVTWRFAEPPAY